MCIYIHMYSHLDKDLDLHTALNIRF
jgi:hypothetical protein